jgi:hypothetical protein
LFYFYLAVHIVAPTRAPRAIGDCSDSDFSDDCVRTRHTQCVTHTQQHTAYATQATADSSAHMPARNLQHKSHVL